ncbi:MAG TPA: hypothetical protein VF219_21330 [Vicinamibacterales bacterium]
MTRRLPRVTGKLLLVAMLLPLPGTASSGQKPMSGGARVDGPFARIAILRPNDGQTLDFEAGYIRHLQWHLQANDSWVWYGWTVTFAERQRWFVYASFGHSAVSLDNPVSPAEDERDNIINVLPHAQFMGNVLYEYLPALSRGTGVPTPAARLELTITDLNPGGMAAFEAAIRRRQSTLRDETLWYRSVAGGPTPRYVRLRPRASLSAIVDEWSDQALPDETASLVAKTTVEILSLRPTMSLGLERK